MTILCPERGCFAQMVIINFKMVKKINFEKSHKFFVQEIEKDTELRIVTGEVLVPEEVDSQGDIISEDEIRKTAHNFLSDYRGEGNKVQHSRKNDKLRIVESYISLVDMEINKHKIKKGSWVMSSKILDDKIWDQIKKGELTGYSIGGQGFATYED